MAPPALQQWKTKSCQRIANPPGSKIQCLAISTSHTHQHPSLLSALARFPPFLQQAPVLPATRTPPCRCGSAVALGQAGENQPPRSSLQRREGAHLDCGSREMPGSIAGRVFHFHLGEGSQPCNLHLARLPACASWGRITQLLPPRQSRGSCKVAAVRHSQTKRQRNKLGWVGGYGRSQCPERADGDQAQAPSSLLEVAVSCEHFSPPQDGDRDSSPSSSKREQAPSLPRCRRRRGPDLLPIQHPLELQEKSCSTSRSIPHLQR